MKLKYGPYSPSRLEAAVCGYAFERQYINPKTKGQKSEGLAQARGSVVHEVYEYITKRLRDDAGAQFTHEEIRTQVAAAVQRHPAAYQDLDNILEMVRLYIKRPVPQLTKDAGIELKLAIKFVDGVLVECDYDDPDAIARGRADILMISDDTTKAIIYDHKTQPNVEEPDTYQLGFYAWVILKIYPFLESVETTLHFARYGMYKGPYTWTRADLEHIEDSVMTRIMEIESRTSWDPIPNKLCQYCPVVGECPIYKDQVVIDEDGRLHAKNTDMRTLGDTNKAVKIAGLLTVLDQVYEHANNALKEHIKISGPVAIPGKIYEYKVTESVDWDKVNRMKPEVIAIFKEHNVDHTLFMSFNQTASKAIWLAENEALVKALSAKFPRTPSSKFGGYKL